MSTSARNAAPRRGVTEGVRAQLEPDRLQDLLVQANCEVSLKQPERDDVPGTPLTGCAPESLLYADPFGASPALGASTDFRLCEERHCRASQGLTAGGRQYR